MLGEIAGKKQVLIADMNRFQLSDGLDNTGGYLPRYVDDPYFRTIAQALAYQEWKEGISPSDTKPKEVMDFRIRGDFHMSIKAKVKNMDVELYSTSPIAADVQRKTGGRALGINPQSAAELWEYSFRPALLKGMASVTGIGISRRA